MNRIIYKTESGIAILIPTGELSIDDVAKKDVPAGIVYKIVDISDIPEDRTFRAAWEADFSNPDGYGLGYEAWLQQQPAKPEVISNDND